MTSEGKKYAWGAVIILVMALLLLLWSVLLWIALGLLGITLLVIGWLVWGVLQQRLVQHRIARADAAKAELEVEEARIRLEQHRALAAQQWQVANQQHATALALWNQQRMIPASMVGVLLEDPAQRERVLVWPTPRRVTYTSAPPQEVPPAALPAPTLPRAHSWESIERLIGPDHFYLGAAIDEEGQNSPVWVPLDGIITLVSIGPQGLGKTTLARAITLMQVMQGGEVAICDWYNDIAAEMSQFFPHCYSEPDDCERYVKTVLRPEMERRHAAYKQGRRDFPPLVWIIDEWAMLKKPCPAMAEALVWGFTIWRKVGLRLLVSGVALDTRDLGVSKSAVSTLALFSANENLARTWGLSGIKPQLDQLYRTGQGYCLITSQHLQRYAALLAFLHADQLLFRTVLQRTRHDLVQRAVESYAGLPPLSPRRESGEWSGTRLGETFPDSLDSLAEPQAGILNQREREYVAARYRAGALRTAIRDELRAQRREGFSNRHWEELKEICDIIDAERGQA